MKLNKIFLPLLIALVAISATTGCKKGLNPGLTKLPGQRGTGVPGNEPPPNTIPFPETTVPITSTTSQTGPIGYDPSKHWDPTTMDQDRVTLAPQTVHFAFDSAALLSKEESKLIIVSEKMK